MLRKSVFLYPGYIGLVDRLIWPAKIESLSLYSSNFQLNKISIITPNKAKNWLNPGPFLRSAHPILASLDF